ncbi:MAG: glutamine amidotransferase [Phycisphaerae bacterium]
MILKSHLEYGLDLRLNLPDVSVDVSKTTNITIPFIAPSDSWGCLIKAELFDGEKCLSQAQDVFAVGTNPFRLGQQSSQGGGLFQANLGMFKEGGVWQKRWQQMKGTWLETFGALPSEFCGLKTEWEEWITMQGKYRSDKVTIRALTETAHRLGMKVMMYNNATPSGWVGVNWARKHPDWLSYNYMGGMRADMNVLDIEKQKSWHTTLTPHMTTFFHPLYLNFNNPGIVEFGCDQMLDAVKDLGYDGVRFDGHWILGDVWSGIGYDMAGRRPNRGESVDRVNMGILKHMKEYVWARCKDFLFGFNYGSTYDNGGQRSPGAYRVACSDGSMILWEGSMFDDAYSDWQNGAAKLRECALRVHQNGGVFYGQAMMLHAPDRFSVNDFSLRYFLITNFAATSHIYAGVYEGHPNYRPLQALYYRFALRFGELLYDEKLKPIAKPQDHLSVTVNGGNNPALWWKPYTYKRQLCGRYQIITHLVNMPVSGVTKTNSTPDRQPAPLRDVRISLVTRPERIFLLDPEAETWIQEVPTATTVVIPELKAWKILVQEFSGSAECIPVEAIWEGDFKGQDKLPDPQNGKVVLPITLFVTGATAGDYYSKAISGTRLVEDKDAILKYALRCQADPVKAPIPVIFGPNHSMPIMAPGKVRVTFQFKVSDNTRTGMVCAVDGQFGRHEIPARAFRRSGVYQAFSYDYYLREGLSNYIDLDYYGGSDLTVDSIVMQELHREKDTRLFAQNSLDVAKLAERKQATKKVHILRGLWHDYYGMDEALKKAGMTVSDSWEQITTDHADIPEAFPVDVDELFEYDLVMLLNASADSLKPNRRKNLREYVLRGGTLFVGGGPRAFGHGGYDETFLAEILPVEIHRHDMVKVHGDDQLISPSDSEFLKGISFSQQPQTAFIHVAKAKPGAEVLLRAGNHPVLTVWTVGRGTVYAMTGTPLGEPEGSIGWWEWDGWKSVVLRILAKASPPDRLVTKQADRRDSCPVLGRLEGKTDLRMFDGKGKEIPPLESEGITLTPKGISFNYDGPPHQKGVLKFRNGLIKPQGSITFTIIPGWEPDIQSLDQSVPLFCTYSDTGGVLQIYIYVYKLGGETFAFSFYVHTNDVGIKEGTDHFARYGVNNINEGGLRFLKKSIWKKGQEYRVTVRWSPSQIVVWEGGERMAVSDFAPEMNLRMFTGPLYIGSDRSRTLARSILKDIVIQGE